MKHAWNLPESMLSYGIEHFKKYIESDVQDTILNDNPVPEKMKEMLLEATKFRELKQDRSLEKFNKMFLDPRKSTSIVKEESHSLIEKSNKLFGPKFEEQNNFAKFI